MTAKPLQHKTPSPPLRPFYRAPLDYMVHHFSKRPQLNPAGALQYAYTTFGAQQQSLVGAGTGLKRQGLRIGSPPMVSLPTITLSGSGYEPGTFSITPVSPAENN